MAVLLCVMGVLLLVVVGVALLEAEDAEAGGGVVGAVEQVVRRNEWLHYQVHMTLGRLFSLHPRTRGRANEEFRKASFHMPLDERLRRRFPDATPQVEALLACQAAVTAHLRDFGFTAAFPELHRASREVFDRTVSQAGGAMRVAQSYSLRAGGAQSAAGTPGVAGSSATVAGSYTCVAQPAALRGWNVTALEFASNPLAPAPMVPAAGTAQSPSR
jgi:hypothetical protein